MSDAKDTSTPAVGRGLAATFVLAALVAGCLLFWVGAPLAGVWLAGRLTSSFGPGIVLALTLSGCGMLAMGVVLAWINNLFLRITGGQVRQTAEGLPFRRRGPLEPLLVICLAAALAALLFWFLVLAENPAVNVY